MNNKKNDMIMTQEVRITEREKALKVLEKARQLEAYRERLVRKGKLKKVVTYDAAQHLTTIRYEKIHGET